MFLKVLYFAACMYPFGYGHNFTVLIFYYRLEKLWASWILMFCFTHAQEMVQISAPRFPRWVENNSFPTWYVFWFLILWRLQSMFRILESDQLFSLLSDLHYILGILSYQPFPWTWVFFQCFTFFKKNTIFNKWSSFTCQISLLLINWYHYYSMSFAVGLHWPFTENAYSVASYSRLHCSVRRCTMKVLDWMITCFNLWLHTLGIG